MEEYLQDVSIDMIPEPYKKLAELITPKGLLKLAELINGRMIYVPQYNSLIRLERNKQILKEFNGKNYRELAERYNLGISIIRKIIKDSK